MSEPFLKYGHYYDRLYHDKDYQAEANFVAGILEKYETPEKSILELGCGTGGHAEFLSLKNFRLTGIDRSESMLKSAAQRLAQVPNAQVSFAHADLRSYRSPSQFGAVVSLFHVVNYLTEDDDLRKFFETIKFHLLPGGTCTFDSWYGPAVLHDRPTSRIKTIESGPLKLTRIAEPAMHTDRNCVDVYYTLKIEGESAEQHTADIVEKHSMRYLFTPEIQLHATNAGLQLETVGEWMTGKPPSNESWSVYYVLKHAPSA